MIWSVVGLAVVCVLLVVALIYERIRNDNFMLEVSREWARERADLLNREVRGFMPPSPLQAVPPIEREEPKDAREYASIGTIEFPPDGK